MRLTKRSVKQSVMALGVLVLLCAVASPATALDAYQDRRGLFTGIGLGGGMAVQGGDPGGAFVLDLQLGGGATKRLTLNLDLDIWAQVWDDHHNWMITPGPEVNFFVTDGLFIRAGIGLPLTFANVEGVDDSDFSIGFDGSLGVGWEFFAGSDLAVGFALEGDYMLLYDHEDVITVGFSLGIRYY